jgi:ATP-dependent DNA helicase RecG
MPSAEEILAAVGAGETKDWEFKSAKGGLPRSLWATYSAMANTDGGVILLGIEEKDSCYILSGLDDPARIQRDFWNSVNNRTCVNRNLLDNQDLTLSDIEEKVILTLRVPRASRRQRPVFVGQNPLEGTYRRNSDGDYRCTPEEVGRMLADQSEEPADSRILEGFGLSDLDPASLQQYRQRFSARDPAHPWLALETVQLLEKLGGWRTDRSTGVSGLTAAGLLMFGKDEVIREPEALPKYHLDYREKLSDDPRVRWTHRLVPDGTWVANLFQFYQRVIVDLTRDLERPFQLDLDLYRKDVTPIHEALREALVNALIHADYRGEGGIVIERSRSRVELSNPGTLLVSYEQLLQGGISECRNKSLQLMFRLMGGGDQAGSGIDKIRRDWHSQHWRAPAWEETQQPDRVRLIMPMESRLPPEALEHLQERFGRRFLTLDPLEVQTLVIAYREGRVSNGQMQMVSDRHPTDLTRMFQKLVAEHYLKQKGQKRGSYYQLMPNATGDGALQTLSVDSTDSGHSDGVSVHNSSNSVHSGESSVQKDTGFAPDRDDQARLLEIAAPARRSRRLSPETVRIIILRVCEGRFMSASQLGSLLDRNPGGLLARHLRPMVRQGDLIPRYADKLHHPEQAYMTRVEPPSS